MKQAYRDRWVAALRERQEPLYAMGMRPCGPCALAMAYVANGKTIEDINVEGEGDYNYSYTPFYREGDWYLGPDRHDVFVGITWGVGDGIERDRLAVEAVYRMSDSGIPPAKIADWIEANIPVTP